MSKTDDSKHKEILVIGSTNHSRATCADWMQSFPNIKEVDVAIVYMPSLSQVTLDYLAEYDPSKLPNAEKEFSTLFSTGRSIYCVYSEPITETRKPEAPKTLPPGMRLASNYDWLFFTPTITKVKPGKSLRLKESIFERYFQNLGEWDLEIQFSKREWGTAGLDATPVAVNRSGEVLATKVTMKHVSVTDRRTGIVYLLPPLKICDQHDTIEILIDIVAGRRGIEYPWRERIEITGLSEIQKEIESHQQTINEINKEIEEAKKRYYDRESYRNLFSIDDQLQVKTVRRILSDFGIRSDITKNSFVVDLRGKDVAIEVTSESGMITGRSSAITQVGRFITQEKKSEKVILVANTYKRLPITERIGKESFSPQMKDHLMRLGVCCISAHCLYFLWKKAQENKISTDSARTKILTKDGELTQSEL